MGGTWVPHAGGSALGAGLAPLGDIRVPARCGAVCDASSGAEVHIWAQSRVLEAGAPLLGDNPTDSGSPGAVGPALPAQGVRLSRMVPVGVLGLLLCLRLCGGERWGAGQGPPHAGAGLSALLAAGTGELRLVGGGGRCAGRVEVKHEGEWGSVCNYDFDWEAGWATVVCRQLGCGTVAKASVYAPFGQGTGRWLHMFCQGTEAALPDCRHFGWGQHYCGHNRDVGVICTDAVELRLAAGRGPCAGRVEVKLQGRWSAVGDTSWDMDDAEVVCQHLGCGSAARAEPAATTFGNGDGPISLAVVNCRGDETSLWDCEIRGWGPYAAIHDFDTAVVCQGFARLLGGDGACAGRLEVRRGRAWVGVCQDGVDTRAAEVVCRELGCGTALAVTGQFGAGTGPLWDGGFECNGTELLLSACTRRSPRGQGCASHAGIICSRKHWGHWGGSPHRRVPPNTLSAAAYTGFRLVNSSSGCAGRVEAEVGGTWGSVCATGWDLHDAHVLCHHLGCGHAVTVPPAGSFGAGAGLLWPDTFGCQGSEQHPGECPVVVLGEPPCPPGHAAAVSCSGIAEPLRLVEGESRCDGRLEVATSPGAWARVLAGLWDAQGASAVCRQLGCGVPEKVHTVPALGTAVLPCVGTEENVTQCNVSGTATTPTSSPEEVAIICSGSRQLRLSGGPGRCAGRVEVYVDSTWTTVCQDTWDLPDATVACRQLGCGTALAVPGSDRFGAGTGPLWPGVGGCTGSEDSLWECPAVAQRGCRRGGGAGTVCSGQLSLRLVGGSGRCRGHLELLRNGTWGRVCASGTSLATATAVCRQLGCGDGGSLVAFPAQVPAPAWLAWVGCEEGTRWLWRCPSAPWHLQPCGRGGDTYIACDEDGDSDGDGVTGSCTQAAALGTVPMALCGVLGTLLCLALAVPVYRAWARHRGTSRAADAVSDAIYEELDYTMAPEYQEVPGHSGSPSEGLRTKLRYHSGDGTEQRDPEAAPGSLDGYDDAMAVLEETPAPGTGDITEGVARRSCNPPAGARRDPPAQPPWDTGYDDVGVSTPRMSP
ncbi:LOW QUALITY PROTEIN: scavenger receptor cysteine-rich type 1 protein M130-like [Aegotheles albertisi]